MTARICPTAVASRITTAVVFGPRSLRSVQRSRASSGCRAPARPMVSITAKPANSIPAAAANTSILQSLTATTSSGSCTRCTNVAGSLVSAGMTSAPPANCSTAAWSIARSAVLSAWYSKAARWCIRRWRRTERHAQPPLHPARPWTPARPVRSSPHSNANRWRSCGAPTVTASPTRDQRPRQLHHSASRAPGRTASNGRTGHRATHGRGADRRYAAAVRRAAMG